MATTVEVMDIFNKEFEQFFVILNNAIPEENRGRPFKASDFSHVRYEMESRVVDDCTFTDEEMV